jgi:hypothetical protein
MTLRGYLRYRLTRTSGGDLQATLPDAPKVPPILFRGKAKEIMSEFDGPDQLHNAVNHIDSPRYA